MTNIRRIDPRKDRMNENCKYLLKAACDAIDGIENNVAGYALVVWDERGRSFTEYQPGGIVGHQAIAQHAAARLNEAITKTICRGALAL